MPSRIIRAILFVLPVALAMLSAPVRAGDTSEIEAVGFSGDGRYLAYLRYGISDGRGLAYADLFFLDAPANKFVPPRVVSIDGDEEENPEDVERVKTLALEEGRNSLLKYRIVTGNFGTGYELYPETPPGDRGWSREFYSDAQERAYMVMSVDRVYEAADCNTEFGPTKIFTLTVHKDFEGEQTPGKVLQEDKKLYKSRGCVLGYSFHSLLIHGDNIVFFVNAETRGFEGPNFRQIVVGGTLVFP